MAGTPDDIAALQKAVATLATGLAQANAERSSLGARVDVLEASLRVRVQTLEEANTAATAMAAVQRAEMVRQQAATESMAATLRERAPVADYVAQQRQRVESRIRRRKGNRR